MARAHGSMGARQFLFLAEDVAMRALPAGIPRPERRVMWTILQLHFGNPAMHFELQPQPSRGVVELGLHFEGPAEANEAAAARVAAQASDLIPALGAGWELEAWTSSWRRLHRTFGFEVMGEELEAWTSSWRRLHRTFGFEVMGEELARAAGEELARAITLLHPFIVV